MNPDSGGKPAAATAPSRNNSPSRTGCASGGPLPRRSPRGPRWSAMECAMRKSAATVKVVCTR